jgi:hypothetical protein
VGDPPVVAFLSAGQCRTRWLALRFRELYPQIDAQHHALGPMYKPRLYFRCYDKPEAILDVPEVAEHFAWLERAKKPYLETGWPLFAALPLLAKRLGSRLRVVHLTRHPVPAALGHLARRRYAGSSRDDAYTRFATLGAGDQRVFQPYYEGCWKHLSPYERCLFWWTEVQLFALEFPGRAPGVPVLRIQSEELLSGAREPLQRLLDFVELPWNPKWMSDMPRLGTHWEPRPADDVDALEVHRHPTTAEVASQLGYDISTLNTGELQARYA